MKWNNTKHWDRISFVQAIRRTFTGLFYVFYRVHPVSSRCSDGFGLIGRSSPTDSLTEPDLCHERCCDASVSLPARFSEQFTQTTQILCLYGIFLFGNSQKCCLLKKSGLKTCSVNEAEGQESSWLSHRIISVCLADFWSPLSCNSCVVLIFVLFSKCSWVWWTCCIFVFLIQHNETILC